MGNFKRCLNFAKTVIKRFKVSKQGTHVGMVIFTTRPKVQFTLKEYYKLAEIESAIDIIAFPGGATFTGEGLKTVKKDVFGVTGRPDVPHMLIILTDGQSMDDIKTPSTALKDDGTIIYCLGIGSDYNMQQLNTMASSPPLGHIFVADFDKLDTVVQSIEEKACTGNAFEKSDKIIDSFSFPQCCTISNHLGIRFFVKSISISMYLLMR
jgi:hypothetical protein